MRIPDLRLHNQQLAHPQYDDPAETVRWLGAVQAQEYASSLWAIGIRTRGATEADVERAVAERKIVRSWPMRSTLHFVHAGDLRWMLDLLAHREISGRAARHRQLELDAEVLARSESVIVRALQGGPPVRRDALYARLAEAGISAAGSRGLHILGHLALHGVLCFGPRDGKQPTFVLLDEWLPPSKPLSRDEALAELARRYFTGHGPATVKDFVWWSGLSLTEARAALQLAGDDLVQEELAGRIYWLPPGGPLAPLPWPHALLLPAFDEYTIAYQDRRAVLDPAYGRHAASFNGIFYPLVVLDGQVIGTWKKTLKKGLVKITVSPFEPLSAAGRDAIAAAAEPYGAFLGLRASVQ